MQYRLPWIPSSIAFLIPFLFDEVKLALLEEVKVVGLTMTNPRFHPLPCGPSLAQGRHQGVLRW